MGNRFHYVARKKEEWKDCRMLRNYHVFISHSWDYNIHYEKVKEWLDSSNYFTWSDYSVPITRPVTAYGVRDLEQKLTNRIAASSCVIILAGMYSTYSRWIDFEIDTAVKMGKPIIGIKPWGQERIPVKIQLYADIMVGWNSTPLVQAIRDHAL